MTSFTAGMDALAHFITRGTLYHVLVGNDSHPAATAVARAIVGATITGALSFLAVWQTTDAPKTLIVAFLIPFLTFLGQRGGVEGLVDTAKRNNGTPEP